MSYIRPLTNPEHMYAYSTGQGMNIHIGSETDVYLDEDEEIRFIKFLKKWRKNFEDDLTNDKFSITEEHRNEDYKIYLKIKNQEIELWYVTFHYFVDNVLR